MNMHESKMKKFKKMINQLVIEEIEKMEPESSKDESSAAVKKVLKALESPQMKSKLGSIKNSTHKADLIVRFAALVGVPSNKKNEISTAIRSLGSSK
jgi:rRNA-processing protein FCF1